MVTVKYGYHGRSRDVYYLTGMLIEETDRWLVVKVDGKKHFIEISKILEYFEE